MLNDVTLLIWESKLFGEVEQKKQNKKQANNKNIWKK